MQNFLGRLPEAISYPAYFWVQRRFGSLKSVDPFTFFAAGQQFCCRLQRCGRSIEDMEILEVGTGRRVGLPLALWLCGAKRIHTVDLNPYLKPELVREDIQKLVSDQVRVQHILQGFLRPKRLEKLVHWQRAAGNFNDLLELCSIQYHAPADAANINLPANSIDLHYSYNVFEHISHEDLRRILEEARRVVRDRGCFAYRIDYSDHFSHSDKSISSINFLQFEDDEWARIAGNRYMYMNRLRDDDYLSLFESLKLKIEHHEPNLDEFLLEGLNTGRIVVTDRFAENSPESLATTAGWFVLSK